MTNNNNTRVMQVGVFTGYSSLAVALALPQDGRLVAFDRDAKTMEVAQKHWQLAGVADKVCKCVWIVLSVLLAAACDVKKLVL